MVNQNSMLNFGDEFVPAIKYCYDDFVAISRQNLSTDGPISQYADNFNTKNMIILPVSGFSNNISQTGDYSLPLLGQGYDPTNFSQDKISIKPNFTVPILCVNDNVPAPYVFDIFDILRKSVYGDASEIVLRINNFSGNNIYFNSYDNFNLKILYNQFNAGSNIVLRVVDGITFKNLSSYHTITSIDTLNNCVAVTPTPLVLPNTYQYATIMINQNYSSLTTGIPPSNVNYQKSTEFYLAVSQQGLFYPTLIDNVNFQINNNEPILNVSCMSKRWSKSDELYLNGPNQLFQQYPIYSIPTIEQARIKVGVGGVFYEFYGLMPVIQNGSEYTAPLQASKSGIHFGSDTYDLTNPQPVLIRNLNLTIANNLQPIYSMHSPRWSSVAGEDFLNNLSRFDNTFAYGFYSVGRKISGTIQIALPLDAWFKKVFSAALNTDSEGTIEIDTGYFNFMFTQVVFDLSPTNISNISQDVNKSATFNFASTGFDAMFEIGLSKTGGRL